MSRQFTLDVTAVHVRCHGSSRKMSRQFTLDVTAVHVRCHGSSRKKTGGKVSMEKVYFFRTFISLVSNIPENFCVYVHLSTRDAACVG